MKENFIPLYGGEDIVPQILNILEELESRLLQVDVVANERLLRNFYAFIERTIFFCSHDRQSLYCMLRSLWVVLTHISGKTNLLPVSLLYFILWHTIRTFSPEEEKEEESNHLSFMRIAIKTIKKISQGCNVGSLRTVLQQDAVAFAHKVLSSYKYVHCFTEGLNLLLYLLENGFLQEEKDRLFNELIGILQNDDFVDNLVIYNEKYSYIFLDEIVEEMSGVVWNVLAGRQNVPARIEPLLLQTNKPTIFDATLLNVLLESYKAEEADVSRVFPIATKICQFAPETKEDFMCSFIMMDSISRHYRHIANLREIYTPLLLDYIYFISKQPVNDFITRSDYQFFFSFVSTQVTDVIGWDLLLCLLSDAVRNDNIAAIEVVLQLCLHIFLDSSFEPLLKYLLDNDDIAIKHIAHILHFLMRNQAYYNWAFSFIKTNWFLIYKIITKYKAQIPRSIIRDMMITINNELLVPKLDNSDDADCSQMEVFYSNTVPELFSIFLDNFWKDRKCDDYSDLLVAWSLCDEVFIFFIVSSLYSIEATRKCLDILLENCWQFELNRDIVLDRLAQMSQEYAKRLGEKYFCANKIDLELGNFLASIFREQK